MATTPTQRLAGNLLGYPVAEFIQLRRESGIAWRHIARELREATSGQIDVTHETVRAWANKEAA